MKLGPITNAIFMEALIPGKHDHHDLEEIVGLKHDTVSQYLKQLHKRRVIHVAEWRIADNGYRIPVFKLGSGVDARKPRAKTAAQRQRECYARKRDRNLQLAMLGKGAIEPSANGLLRITSNL